MENQEKLFSIEELKEEKGFESLKELLEKEPDLVANFQYGISKEIREMPIIYKIMNKIDMSQVKLEDEASFDIPNKELDEIMTTLKQEDAKKLLFGKRNVEFSEEQLENASAFSMKGFWRAFQDYQEENRRGTLRISKLEDTEIKRERNKNTIETIKKGIEVNKRAMKVSLASYYLYRKSKELLGERFPKHEEPKVEPKEEPKEETLPTNTPIEEKKEARPVLIYSEKQEKPEGEIQFEEIRSRQIKKITRMDKIAQAIRGVVEKVKSILAKPKTKQEIEQNIRQKIEAEKQREQWKSNVVSMEEINPAANCEVEIVDRNVNVKQVKYQELAEKKRKTPLMVEQIDGISYELYRKGELLVLADDGWVKKSGEYELRKTNISTQDKQVLPFYSEDIIVPELQEDPELKTLFFTQFLTEKNILRQEGRYMGVLRKNRVVEAGEKPYELVKNKAMEKACQHLQQQRQSKNQEMIK